MSHEHNNLLVALAGQPNCGKSTIFSMLTGRHQHIANFPGVTVEKHAGHYHNDDLRVELVDLPGTYSMTSYSQEERIARDFILLERPEVVVAVADASKLQRNLYFILQLCEMNVPMVLCLNMMDVAKRRGIDINTEKLSQLLNVPVVCCVGTKGIGEDELCEAIRQTATKPRVHELSGWRIEYNAELEKSLEEVEKEVLARPHLIEDFPARWLAVKLMEKDADAQRIVQHHTHDDSWRELIAKVEKIESDFSNSCCREAGSVVTATRCQLAADIARAVVRKKKSSRKNLTDLIDLVACNPVLGFILAAACVYLMFKMTFNLADGWEWIPWANGGWTTPTGVFAWFFGDILSGVAERFVGEDIEWANSLVQDGIIAGVGGVMEFVPVIFFMFIFLAFFEDSGYIARIAFMFDRIMRVFGLQGQSVLPMIIGGGIMGGCAVPGVLATRSMKDYRERLLTMLVVPIMNCGAKIPLYILLVAAFFAESRELVLLSLVVISWIMALLAALIISKTVVRGKKAQFLLELPSYHLPHVSSVWRSAVRRTWLYVKKAGTIILLINVVLWALMYFPRADSSQFIAQKEAVAMERISNKMKEERYSYIEASQKSAQLEYSIAGRVGIWLEPISKYAGFDWRDNVALVGGVAAKEVVVSVLSTAYSMGEVEDESDLEHNPLVGVLRKASGWSAIKAFALLLFVMIYSPCVPTLGVLWRESGSWKWAAFAAVFSTVLAYVIAVGVYQIGNIFIGG